MKIYEIKTGSEKVWVASSDPISAIHCADIDGIIDIGAATEGDDIKELPQSSWAEHCTTDENGQPEERFDEIIKKATSNSFVIASTLGA